MFSHNLITFWHIMLNLVVSFCLILRFLLYDPNISDWRQSAVCIINNIYYILNFKSYKFANISVGKIHWFEGFSYPRRGQASSTRNKSACISCECCSNEILFGTEWKKCLLSYSLLGWKTSLKLCMEIQICK